MKTIQQRILQQREALRKQAVQSFIGQLRRIQEQPDYVTLWKQIEQAAALVSDPVAKGDILRFCAFHRLLHNNLVQVQIQVHTT